MNHSTLTHTLTRTVLLASMALGSVALADAPIVKCTDAQGRITLTDAGCPTSSDMEIVLGSNNESPGDAHAAYSSSSAHSTRRPVRRALMAYRQPVERGLSLDVATLKAAKAAFVVLDSTRTPRYVQLASN
jgi:hypothetical protein